MKADVLAFWHTLKADAALNETDRIIGAAVARTGSVPTGVKLMKTLGGWPKVGPKKIEDSLARLTARGHLAAFARPARTPRRDEAAA